MERVPMTKEGYEKMRLELSHLKTVERPQNIHDIEVARSHGDISENAEFHAAKEKQSVLAARTAFLEDRLARSEVIDPKSITTPDRVVFGATVTVCDTDTGEEIRYQIVGDDESDAKTKRIGISSPMARAVVGKNLDEVVKVKTPKGDREMEIVKIEYV